MRIQLAHLSFDSKKDARDYLRAIREKYEYGQLLDSDDFVMVKAAIGTMKIDKRPKLEDINTIQVVKINTGRPHKNFIIILNDGNTSSFSLDNCFPPENSKRDEKKEKFNAASRVAITDQITRFKKSHRDNQGKYWCVAEKKEVAEAQVHVDHDEPSFHELISDFIQCEGIQLDEVKYYKQNYQRIEFKDEILKIKWQIFHEEKAQLQILCDQCNLRKKKDKNNRDI
jgi:hypothetical protein